MSNPLTSFGRRLTGCAVMLLVAVGAASAQTLGLDARPLTFEGHRAYEQLLVAPNFAVGGVGFGAEMSEGESALRRLLWEKGAVKALKSLVEEATPEGALYALVGLHVKDPAAFRTKAEDFLKRSPLHAGHRLFPYSLVATTPDEVVVTEGCVTDARSAREVVEKIGSGAFDNDFDCFDSCWLIGPMWLP